MKNLKERTTTLSACVNGVKFITTHLLLTGKWEA